MEKKSKSRDITGMVIGGFIPRSRLPERTADGEEQWECECRHCGTVKILRKGNITLFHDICHYKELTDYFDGKTYKLVLCHYPILMWAGQHKGTILLYGHTHATAEETFFQDCIARMNDSEVLSQRCPGDLPIRAINVGACMKWMQYEPRTLKEILCAMEVMTK